MQVVYSGSNTPLPSPNLQRKTGYGRPVQPGYKTHVHPQILVNKSRDNLTEGDTPLRDSIPAMSKTVAVTCLILNIIIPGSGTLTAGLSVLCCSQVRQKNGSKSHCVWVNSGVALLQFLLTFLFLLGWIWSIMWGVSFLSISNKYKQSQKAQKRLPEKQHTKEHQQTHQNYNHSYQQHNKQNINSHKCKHSPRNSHPKKIGATDSEIVCQNNNALQDNDKDGSGYQHPQPIIVLQQASAANEDDEGGGSQVGGVKREETLLKARTRHQKILQRHMSDNDLSPFVLTHQQLEAIVIHDVPVNTQPPPPPPAPRSGYVDIEGLPKR